MSKTRAGRRWFLFLGANIMRVISGQFGGVGDGAIHATAIVKYALNSIL